VSAKSKLPIQWIEGSQVQGKAPLQEDYLEVNAEKGIFILADGFGGSQGKTAAKLAVQSVRKFLEQEAGDLDATLPFELRSYYSLAGNVLFNAVTYANQQLMQANKGRSWINSGGASLVAGYLDGKLLALANVGACSVSIKRNGKLKEIVSPKTLARQSNPFDDDEEGRLIPLMSFGTVRQLEPEIVEVEIKPQDQLLFQSAGVTETVRNQLIKLSSAAKIRHYFDEIDSEANASVIWVSF